MKRDRSFYLLVINIVYLIGVLIYFFLTPEGEGKFSSILLILGGVLLLINQYLVYKKK